MLPKLIPIRENPIKIIQSLKWDLLFCCLFNKVKRSMSALVEIRALKMFGGENYANKVRVEAGEGERVSQSCGDVVSAFRMGVIIPSSRYGGKSQKVVFFGFLFTNCRRLSYFLHCQ